MIVRKKTLASRFASPVERSESDQKRSDEQDHSRLQTDDGVTTPEQIKIMLYVESLEVPGIVEALLILRPTPEGAGQCYIFGSHASLSTRVNTRLI
jgi:hypothetical protein